MATFRWPIAGSIDGNEMLEIQVFNYSKALSDAYQRTMQQYRDVQKKMRHFVTIDAKRLEEIWLMNEAEVRGLMEKALEIDCVVHEQQLAVPWARPPLAVADRSGQQGAAHASFPTGLLALQNDGTEHRHLGGLNISAPTLKKLLELLYDETGFFAEGKILTLLVPLEKDERSCVQLDAVIMALGIEDEDDGHQLANFLTKYRQQKMEDVGTAESKTLVGTDEGRSDESWDIHPSEVLAALRVFAAEHHGLRSQPFIFTPPVNWLIPKKTPQRFNRGDTETAAYWEAMANVITEPKLKLWAALDAALGKYHTVLNQRSKLLVETQSLRQQNTELKMLLHQYMNSKVDFLQSSGFLPHS
ncbi:dynein regulatory complex protein 1 [Arapaima gigas]